MALGKAWKEPNVLVRGHQPALNQLAKIVEVNGGDRRWVKLQSGQPCQGNDNAPRLP